MKKELCRICKSKNLYMFLDLGFHPHSDQFRLSLDREETRYPLRFNRCRDCGFVQLDYVVSPETLYKNDYLYETSITKTGDRHWSEFASMVSQKIGLNTGDGVIDIGSNDGTLLSKFKDLGMHVCGIDPCKDVTDIAATQNIPTITDFFSENSMLEAKKKVRNLKLITGTNVFAHIDNLDNVLEIVAKNIGEGVFVFESPYFGNFYNGLQYDTAYHQHLSYLSLRPLIPFFKKYGLTIFDVEKTNIHGGSFRVYSAKNHTSTPAVEKMLAEETWTDEDMDIFAEKVQKNKNDLFELVYSLWKAGKKIAAVSSPAKGQTLLNYTGIGRFIDFATDKSKLKQGRYTPGTHIKIYPDDELLKRNPDYVLLLAWNFAEEIMQNNREYKGKWIIPIPTLKII